MTVLLYTAKEVRTILILSAQIPNYPINPLNMFYKNCSLRICDPVILDMLTHFLKYLKVSF